MDSRAPARIYADDQRLIEVSPDCWRLLSANGDGEGHLLAETTDGPSLQYPAAFGSRQRLPENMLAATDIERVVLGWSASDETWHLGLILAPPLAETRGSRWCGLARWNDPAAEARRSEASEASRALALALAKPLAIVPPRPAGAASIEAPAAPPPPLPALPYALDDWTLTAPAENQLQFTLKPAWARGQIIRAVLYLLWALGFLVMSVTSLTSGIRLPDPIILPYLGLASALLLTILGIRSLVVMLRQPRVITVDGVSQTISGANWQVSADQLEAVYASQAVKLKTRGTPVEHIRYGELNLLRKDGSFKPVLTRLRFDIKQSPSAPPPDDGSMARLSEYNARTSLQAAAVQVGRLFGLTVWDDRRSE
ncbi:MAG: hypothetical protein JNL34_00575 [Anaerolineae bacterium]|nr:hypothetical protein [Anaerolineae bacterium]